MQKILFYIFVFFLPWQTRLILTPEKPEFLAFSVYFSEIILWLGLAFWLTSVDLKKIRIPRVLMFLCFYVFVSILWSSDRIAAFRLWLFIFDGIMVYLFLREHENIRRGAVKIFLFSIFVAASFGIWQFFNLGSGAFKWLGLSERGAWNLGDIVIESGGFRWLRAYGPFPHPNIFGGYLAAGILLLMVNFPLRRRGIKGDLIIYFLAAILFFALFLTFSRSAWLAFALAVIYFIFKFYKKKRPTLTCAAAQVNVNNKRENIFNFFIFLCVLAVASSIIFWPMLRTRATSTGRLEQKSNTERVASWKNGLSSWLARPVFGTGINNNIITNYELRITNKIQEPPHNIFILVLSQLGLAGFTIYLFIWKKFWSNPAARPFLILFFVIGMFDHYLWTLYSGQALFWTIFAFFSNVDGGG